MRKSDLHNIFGAFGPEGRIGATTRAEYSLVQVARESTANWRPDMSRFFSFRPSLNVYMHRLPVLVARSTVLNQRSSELAIHNITRCGNIVFGLGWVCYHSDNQFVFIFVSSPGRSLGILFLLLCTSMS
jgi:hypothetical protein